jgi:peptide/nickel transport system substrate-binding protein
MTRGEVDWYEQPPIDLVPLLRQKPGITIQNVPLGLILLMRFNHLQPPFDNPQIRRAVMMAMQQDDYMQAVVGTPEYYKEAKTFFTPGSPMSTGAGGADAMKGDLARAKAMLQETGYKGEPVILLAPADQPIAYNQSLVTQELLKKLGMNVDLVSTDWGSFIGRRGNRGAPDKGGWSVFHTLWSGADTLNPALHPLIRANGAAAWFGWPEDPVIEDLRAQWIATADEARQKEISAHIERRAFEIVPYAPAGLVQQPMAYRANLKGMVLSPVQFFWNIEKT